MDFGRFGLWSSSRQWPTDPAAVDAVAREVEALGYGALWLGNANGDLVLAEQILAATSALVVGTSIVNIWQFDAPAVAAAHHRVASAHPGRFMLGLGVGHAPLVREYVKPLAKLGAYLDELEAAPHPVPTSERIVAALGPKAVDLAARRSAGTSPYLVTPEYTAQARAQLGAGPLMITEQKAFLGTDVVQARAAARRTLEFYLQLPNYLNNFRRFGFDDNDFVDGGSDRLVDALVAWGDESAVISRLQAQLDAGADHVAVHALSAEPSTAPPLEAWRRIAAVLGLTSSRDRRPVSPGPR